MDRGKKVRIRGGGEREDERKRPRPQHQKRSGPEKKNTEKFEKSDVGNSKKAGKIAKWLVKKAQV